MANGADKEHTEEVSESVVRYPTIIDSAVSGYDRFGTTDATA